ncbi:hypothetical protein CY34DRAFT_813723 [Suillus luteus UH-Slu-Lm8-n1]|uniref:Uncharacterized protein n=1 Tax=Suillus luteus UH-Slu-Lm8-n1 TaxID=930992 RepID=A0A0D0AMM6_9AGAM|nr:hypothetical protein CY34DRAFT_813723 [Suillus luteus UH-Slu-Lm8-n1]
MPGICMCPRTCCVSQVNLIAELHMLPRVYPSGILTAMTGPLVGASIAEKTHNVNGR